jgi:hypothetical protein
MPKTKIEAALAAAEQEHSDDAERAEMLRRTRQFKSSWIDLAEALTESRRRNDFRRWGYDSFEDYTRRELLLKQETVDKLTGSFLFLKKRAPEVLSRDGLQRTIPSYQVVDFLRRAETESEAPESTVEQLRKRVLEDGAGLPSVVREFKNSVFPVDPEQKKKSDVAALLNVAKRLRELLDETDVVPRKLGSDVSKTLDRLLDVLRENDERAA